MQQQFTCCITYQGNLIGALAGSEVVPAGSDATAIAEIGAGRGRVWLPDGGGGGGGFPEGPDDWGKATDATTRAQTTKSTSLDIVTLRNANSDQIDCDYILCG